MSEGSSGPWGAPEAPVASPPDEGASVKRVVPADRPARSVPRFPAEQAERAIAAFSRFAGPAIFVLALGGLIWFAVKSLI